MGLRHQLAVHLDSVQWPLRGMATVASVGTATGEAAALLFGVFVLDATRGRVR